MYKKFIYVYIMNNLSTNLTDINNSVGNRPAGPDI